MHVQTEEVEGEVDRFIATAWAAQNSPLSNSREPFQTFFLYPRALSHSHAFAAFGHLYIVTASLWCSAFSSFLSTLLVSPLTAAVTVPSMLMASPSYAVIRTVMSLSLLPSLLHTLSHSVWVSESHFNDRLSLCFLASLNSPEMGADSTRRCEKDIILIPRFSVRTNMPLLVSLCCLKLDDSWTE